MKHGHLTEQRKQFIEAYCRLGNGNFAENTPPHSRGGLSLSICKKGSKIAYGTMVRSPDVLSMSRITSWTLRRAVPGLNRIIQLLHLDQACVD